MKQNKKSLIDLICEMSDCIYVSDLRTQKMYSSISVATNALLNEDISDEEWINAADYISQGKLTFTCGKLAKEYLASLH